jgi:hypothetical protein
MHLIHLGTALAGSLKAGHQTLGSFPGAVRCPRFSVLEGNQVRNPLTIQRLHWVATLLRWFMRG